MDPNVWGPPFWFSLHTVTFNYPIKPDEADQIRIKTFFKNLEYILPCVICRVHYAEHTASFPIDDHVGSRKELVMWLFNLHNKVNMSLGKKQYQFEEVFKFYEEYYGKKIELGESSNGASSQCSDKCKPKTCITNNKQLYLGFFLAFFIVLIIYLFL